MGLVFLTIPIDHVDIVELNHCNAVDYWLFWEWTGENYHIVDWRSYRNKDQIDKFNKILYKMESSHLRKIKYKWFRETWTFYDPEIRDQYTWPKKWRRKLSNHN